MSQLRIDGIDATVARPASLTFDDLRQLPDQVADIGTLVPGREGGGVRLRAVLAVVGVQPQAAHLTLTSADGGFSICVPLDAVADAVVAYRLGDAPLPGAKGGPFRFYIPNIEQCTSGTVDACANVKDLGHLQLSQQPTAVTHEHPPQAPKH